MSTPIRMIILSAIAMVGGLPGCATVPAVPGPARPAQWAEPVTPSVLDNFYRVSPGLYRSAQPDQRQWAALHQTDLPPIQTVVNLRPWTQDVLVDGSLGSNAAQGPTQVQLPFYTSLPDPAQVLRFLKIATDPARQPVLVHCYHGSDRTGLMVASYRMVVQGWSAQAAIAEMTRGGYGFHRHWQNVITWLQAMDVAAYRQALALPSEPVHAPSLH